MKNVKQARNVSHQCPCVDKFMLDVIYICQEYWTNTFLVDFWALARVKLKVYEAILWSLFDLLYCCLKFKMKQIVI